MFEMREAPGAMYARLAPDPIEPLIVGSSGFEAFRERDDQAKAEIGKAWPLNSITAADLERFTDDDVSAIMGVLVRSIPDESERRTVAKMFLGAEAVARHSQRLAAVAVGKNARDANYRAELVAAGEDPEDVRHLERPGTGPTRGPVRAMERRERRLAPRSAE